MSYPFNQAVVIGGSFAGLWTARVLSDFFENVIILERDQLPDFPQSRPGVPQDQHVHLLLERGAEIMKALFPNIEDELLLAGAKHIDLTEVSLGYVRGAWLERFPSGHYTYACSRLLLESVVRNRVRALPNVTFQCGAVVDGLTVEDGRVTAVSVLQKGGVGKTAVSADFIVDASGRRSKTPQWLTEWGYAPVEETIVDAKIGYAGRRYKKPASADIDWNIMLISADPNFKPRGGLIYGEENDEWMVMLIGASGDYPPTDETEFLSFAKDVGAEFFDFISNSEPIGKIIGYRKMENCLRHYERFPAWPDRFVVLGDAVCGLNPIYGQGMSVAAMAAEALMKQFNKWDNNLDGLGWGFQRKYPKIIDAAWLLATSSDQEWLGGQEVNSIVDRVAGWYFPKLLEALPHERVICEAFVEIQNLTQPPAVLFSPKVAWHVLKHQLQANRIEG